MKQYTKFAVQVVVTAMAAVAAALAGDNAISASEWANVLIVGLGAVSVLGAGNLPAGIWSYTKTIVAAVTAAVVYLQSAITDGVTYTEWVQLFLAAAGALGVFAVSGPVVDRHAVPRSSSL